MEQLVEKLYSYFGVIKKIGIVITGVAVLFMMFFISVDVLGRNLLGISIPGNYEIVQNYLMPLLIFPVLAYTFSEGMMPRLELILDRLPQKGKRYLEVIIRLADILVMFLLILFSWDFMVDGFINKITFVAGKQLYPVYFLYALPPIAFAMIIVEDLFSIFKTVSCSN